MYAPTTRPYLKRLTGMIVGLAFITYGCQRPLPKPTAFSHADNVQEKIAGQLLLKQEWQDKRGAHVAVFATEETSDNSVWLTIEHHLAAGTKLSRLHRIRDGVKACFADNVTSLLQPSVTLDDHDGDGNKALSFIYYRGCVSDVSPYDAVLLILDGERQYRVEGRVPFEFDPSTHSDEFLIDSGVESWPSVFREHAKALWARHAKSVYSNREGLK